MNGLDQEVQNEEEDVVSLVFETISSIAEQKSKLLNNHFP